MKVCTCCKKEYPLEEFPNRSDREGKKYSTCKPCYAEITRKRAYERYQKLYRKGRRSPLEMTEELRKEWVREKAAKRATRAKQARMGWDKELTDFVTVEAHRLRQLRNKLFTFEWHVDHIIPLKGEIVCGLHVWNNLAVIPKVENLRKGNYHSVHD
jgi:hypothetical protein